MKTPSKKKKRIPPPEIAYISMQDGEENLNKAFDTLFEEVMRRKALSTHPK
jgi:hypothetical protein